MLKDSYLFDAGWLFLAAWGMIVAVVSMAAFGRDLFPSKARDQAASSVPPLSGNRPAPR